MAMDGSPLANDEVAHVAEAAWFEADATARLVLTRRLDVVRINGQARALLQRQDAGGWRLDTGRLRSPERNDDRLLAFVSAARPQACHTVIIGGLLLRGRALTAAPGELVGLDLRDLQSAAALTSADLEPVFGVTRAEQQTLLLLLRGYSAAEIAESLNKSVLTVRTHVKHMHAKLNVRTKEQLFARVTPYLFID